MKQLKTKYDHSEIVYFESDANYTKIFFTNGKFIILSYTLKKIEELYAVHSLFLRVHRSFLINQKHIDKVSSNGFEYSVVMNNKTIIPVSRRKRNVLNIN